MDKFKTAAAAFTLLAGVSVMAGSASAMPVNGQIPAAASTIANVQHVRWVCGPYRCWWAPGPYYWRGPYWGPRWGWGWGWHRGWRRW